MTSVKPVHIDRRPLDEVEAENGDLRIRYFFGSNKERIRVDGFINIFERQFPIDRVLSVRPIYNKRLPSIVSIPFNALTYLIDLAVSATLFMIIAALILFLASPQGFFLETIVAWNPVVRWLPEIQAWSNSSIVALTLVLASAVIWVTSIIVYETRNFLEYALAHDWIEVMLIDGHIERFRWKADVRKNYKIFTWAENYLSGASFSSDSVPVIKPIAYPNDENSAKRFWPEFNPAQLLQLNFESTSLNFHLISLSPIKFGKWYWIEAVTMGVSGIEVRKGRQGRINEIQKAGSELFKAISGPDGLTYIEGYGERKLGSSYQSEIEGLRGKISPW
ncbi:hypothetical protein [Sulfitobacter sp. 20_GPM-1509m]|uniref:hypothetical protein n=1 Tax=Sulfitobacter sp. 20_GPM-1509m TaxID=1380367 RepID=UPI0012DE42C9|nr:hypothetical protein [Sulfitobacter sp. 20_GPM-1509m]